MNWEDIERVNKEISTIEFKGKDYAEVKERVIAFRKLFPLGQIYTDIEYNGNYVQCEARAYGEDEKMLSQGHARELINKPFALENCETSAIGRCLGFLGLGINTAIASKEDMEQTESESGVFVGLKEDVDDLVNKVKAKYDLNTQVRIMNFYHVQRIEDIQPSELERLLKK